MNDDSCFYEIPHCYNVNTIVSELKRLSKIAHDISEFDLRTTYARQVHDQILYLIDGVKDKNIVDSVLSMVYDTPIPTLLSDFNSKFHRENEILLAESFLSRKGRADLFENSWINKGFYNLLNNQIARWHRIGILEHVGDKDIYIVGGGALPQTQFHLMNHLKNNIISIEIDEQSAELCRQVLSKIGCRNGGVINYDGRDFDYYGGGMVIIATLVDCKQEVGERVTQTSVNSLISPRSPVGLHAIWRTPVTPYTFSSNFWELLDFWSPEDSSIASLCYKRRLL